MPRHEFLYDIQYWEALRIIQGYQRRNRDLWNAFRWQTHMLMRVQVGDKELQKNNIHKSEDLITFPWDDEAVRQTISEEDVKKMKEEMRAMNQGIRQNNK